MTVKPTISQRRKTRQLAVWNGAIWAVGNGLAGTTLVIYLARELHAERLGLGIGLLVAMPHIVGLLRLSAPAAIERLGNRKRFCILAFLLSGAMLLILPVACTPGLLPSPAASLSMLISLWCLHHLFQYLGMVGLWSWISEMAPTRIRGRFLGWRERWLVAGQAASAVAAGLFVWTMKETLPNQPAWVPYGIAAALGAAFMLAAVLPLLKIPENHAKTPSIIKKSSLGRNLSALLLPFTDRRFRRLLYYGCWFSFFNGFTQSAQHYYPMEVLGVSLLLSLSVQTAMRVGQIGVSPKLGAIADRIGNRPVLIVSQLLVAAGLLFFAAATPEHWYWFLGAWFFWIAYAGLNVCLPNLLLKLSPDRSNAPHIAMFYAVSGLCYAISTIVGGAIVDRYKTDIFPFFTCLFLFGFLARSAGSLLLLFVIEPEKTNVCGHG